MTAEDASQGLRSAALAAPFPRTTDFQCGGLVMAIDESMPLVCEQLAATLGYHDHLGLCCFGEQGLVCGTEWGGNEHVRHGNLMVGCMLWHPPATPG